MQRKKVSALLGAMLLGLVAGCADGSEVESEQFVLRTVCAEASSCVVGGPATVPHVTDAISIEWPAAAGAGTPFSLRVSTDGLNFDTIHEGRIEKNQAHSMRFSLGRLLPVYALEIALEARGVGAWADRVRASIDIPPIGGGGGTIPETYDPLLIVAIDASADDGNVPANMLDGNPGTRWSCSGLGCQAIADLGGTQKITAVDVAWHQGNVRTSNYVIAVSADGEHFTDVASGVSSGTTLDAERYAFDATEAHFVRLTVNGNSTNLWASVAELGVRGTQLTTPVVPEPEPEPEPEPGSDVDTFGVKMIYPTRRGGEEWFLAADPNRDSRFDPKTSVTKNSDGSWKMRSNQVRMSAMTSTGYDRSKIPTYDRNELVRKGYMQAPNDWKNVEMTGFVKVNSASDRSDNFAWYARGGRHSDGIACEGSAYKGSLHYDGRTRFQKESWHVSYDQSSYRNTTSSIMGRWVGFKTVMRNVTVGGRTAVKLELWLNDNADRVSWTKVYDMVDDGSWGGDSRTCGASSDSIPMTWGGPLAVFRWDSAGDVDFKWLSVREID